jgi:hypothetical protein
MTQPKYYTPEVEEFHIGFEYEINTVYPEKHLDGYGFIKTAITKDNWPLNMDCINLLDRVRVKLLDEEDILSLKWEKISNLQYQFPTNIQNQEIILFFQQINQYAAIHIKQTDPVTKLKATARETIFGGTIKNKSQLLTIMKMTTILPNM